MAGPCSEFARGVKSARNGDIPLFLVNLFRAAYTRSKRYTLVPFFMRPYPYFAAFWCAILALSTHFLMLSCLFYVVVRCIFYRIAQKKQVSASDIVAHFTSNGVFLLFAATCPRQAPPSFRSSAAGKRPPHRRKATLFRPLFPALFRRSPGRRISSYWQILLRFCASCIIYMVVVCVT